MNRKQAVLTVLAGAVSWVKLARSAPREDQVPLRPIAPPPADDLQKQVAELTRRVAELEAAQSRTVGFSKVGSDLVLAPTSGNVLIKTTSGTVSVESSKVNVKANSGLELKSGGTVVAEANSSFQLKAGGTLTQTGATITLN
jgi:hypothetical protein